MLSDTSVPGEGEHKMMDYIRNLRQQPGYDPNTRHCFYGPDADLIMLSLVTHEPHFVIIREIHQSKSDKRGVQRQDVKDTSELQLIHISLLRDYFLLEYREFAPIMKMRFDLERIIDDFIFFCFFIGNDFLPSLVTLDIYEGSLDQLIDFYKSYLPHMTDYITENGRIFWDRAEPFIGMLAKHEDTVFSQRVEQLKRYIRPRAPKKEYEHNNDNRKVSKTMKTKLSQKRQEKCTRYYLEKVHRHQKKMFLLKKFAEKADDEAMKKYKDLRNRQREDDGQIVEEKEGETLRQVLEELRAEYLSDLNPEEIPDSELSDVGEEEVEEEKKANEERKQAEETQAEPLPALRGADQLPQYVYEENYEFMSEFVSSYKQDGGRAKAEYYLKKVKFNVASEAGKADHRKMLLRYLQGMQWVLYYYYTGVKHWRWYYPYHYAPMISDLGQDIVANYLGGATTIEDFAEDDNCSKERAPYTPFQQLLCILPVKSLKQCLPQEYLNLATGILSNFFPDDFQIDLNGRTLPWEAAILIPFADERLFMEEEQKLYSSGYKPSPLEQKRNANSFVYPAFKFEEHKAKAKDPAEMVELKSTLTSMLPLANDCTTSWLQEEYQHVGQQQGFLAKLLPGVKTPQPGFPSLQWMGVQKLDFVEGRTWARMYRKAMVKMPQCKEDRDPKEFDKYLESFKKDKANEVFVKYPFQIEGVIEKFEDLRNVHKVTTNPETGEKKMKRYPQEKNNDEFRKWCLAIKRKLGDYGIDLDGEVFNLVTVKIVIGVQDQKDGAQKVYHKAGLTLPLSLCMKRRSKQHFMNVSDRVKKPGSTLQEGQLALCLSNQLFGVVGKIKSIDNEKGFVRMDIDFEQEEMKLHHPFFGITFLHKFLKADGPKAQSAFFDETEVEKQLGLTAGTVHKITSSFNLSYQLIGQESRKVADLGLNVKNYFKQCHVPGLVRYLVEDTEPEQDKTQPKKSWQYSSECVEIIKAYQQAFPEVFVAITKELAAKRKNEKSYKGLNGLYDLFPDLAKQDYQRALKKMDELIAWLQGQASSQLEFVDMGFDSLDPSIISKLAEHQQHMARNYQPVQLQESKKTKNLDLIHFSQVYQECFPYWSPPHSFEVCEVADFKIGSRVMNINSQLPGFVPFGLRGTVVGKTAQQLIVLFDEQFLTAEREALRHQKYKGVKVFPGNVINLTKAFTKLAKEAFKQVQPLLSEKPFPGAPEFADGSEQQGESARAKALRERHRPWAQ